MFNTSERYPKVGVAVANTKTTAPSRQLIAGCKIQISKQGTPY